MDRIQWLLVGIHDKNVTQVFLPLASLAGPLVAQVMVASTMLESGLCGSLTGLTLVDLFKDFP
jgi:hypothetical protein